MRRLVSTLGTLALLAAPLSALADPVYSVTALAGAGSAAYDINNLGQAVGYTTAGGGYHAFLSAGGALTDIGALLGGSSIANSINDAGLVVGDVDAGAFRYSGGGASTIAGVSTAQGVNASGAIVGAYRVPTGDGGTIPHAYSLTGGTLTDLGTLPTGDASWASAINKAGDVVGEATNTIGGAPNFPTDPFVYHAGTMSSLGNFGGVWSAATSINDHGQVVGYSGTPFDPLDNDVYEISAFLYDSTGLHNLGTLAPHWSSIAYDINNLGQIVGTARVAGGVEHAFLYEDGKMIDLNTLIDPASGWVIQDATAINDLQQIVGQACRAGVCEAVRLDLVAAVPEPSAFAMLLGGLAFLGWRRRGA